MSLQKPIKEKSLASLSFGEGTRVRSIAVIADDLTGAAELGGIGLRYSLSVEIATEVNSDTKAELLIISADTRSIKEEDAISKIKQITKELLSLKPQFIYKKIDSVLRGHVVAELKAQMEVLHVDRALVVPANPDLERTIINGQYYYKGELIHLSSFSNDPEFPIKSSYITDMLRTTDVSVVKHDEQLRKPGVTVGEVEKNEDLKAWAERVEEKIVLAGAAGFFAALLDKMQVQGEASAVSINVELQQPILFVCGTAFKKSRRAIREVKAQGGSVSYMPLEIIAAKGVDHDDWSNEIVELLLSSGKAIIAIEESEINTDAAANDLRERMADVVDQVLQKVSIKELVVEGGSTAASIIRKQNFTRLIPVQELSDGVIRMKVEGTAHLHLTIKPGSYDWSHELWTF